LPDNNLIDKLVSLCKRRGLIFPSSEIYGGLNSCWDYGPLGVELKNAIRDFWWKQMTQLHPEIVGIDAAILMHPRVWEASGHVESFTDPMVDCKECKKRFREEDLPEENRIQKTCPECGGALTEIRKFNLMFKTFMGPLEDNASIVYLRPETAQGIYVNYLTVMNTSRLKPPFGIAQVGKAFRNEITPGNFIFRTREFEQMEMQYFVHPSDDDKWFQWWTDERMKFYLNLGINPKKLRLYEHPQDKLAHYAKKALDIEYEFPWGWGELEGIHDRTDFDLLRHSQFSGKDLTYFDESTRERYLPYIIETSAGLNRTLLVVLLDAYYEEEIKGELRVVLKISPHIAPQQVGVFPLVNKGGLEDIAKEIEAQLRPYFRVFYDQKGAIGRRYRRQDEVGTPFCITVDFQTKEDQTVTLRERDSLLQDRFKIDQLRQVLWQKIIQF
jgi:glycyl-tRNA synthetase